MAAKDSFAVVQSAIERQVTRHGGLRAAARVLDIDPGYLCRLRSAEKVTPDDGILRKLGLRRIVSYEALK